MVEITGKRALVEQLVADGLRYVFGNPGTTEQAFLDAVGEHPSLEFILCLHEGVAVSMADAYARATGRPAFVQVHSAPGLGNAMGMIYNAKASNSPLVIFAGQSADEALIQEPILSDDLVSMARPVTKWAWEVRHAADVAVAMRRAMKVALEPPRGPVFISIPLDVMDQAAEVDISPTSHVSWQSRPDPAAIGEAARIIRVSRSPALIVGDGVANAGASAEAVRLAESLGAPIYEGYASEVTVVNDHPLHGGVLPRGSADAPATVARTLGRHDVVVALGSPLFKFVFPEPGWRLPDETTVIHIDPDGWELGKNLTGVLGIRADCRAALIDLLDELGEQPLRGAEDRLKSIMRSNHERRARALALDGDTFDDHPVSAARLMAELAEALPPGAVVFDEATSSSAALARYFHPRPGQYFRARGGGIGPGMPGPVGVKLARPDAPVVAVVSDGAAMYSITALWTAAHHRIPVTWLICNNGRYGILEQNIQDYRGVRARVQAFVGTDLSDPPLRFDRMAEALGVNGRRVDSVKDLRPALTEAIGLGAPALVDILIA